MTDKKHINDSLKNSGKNFNENCTHEKEQIIIDDCNVLKCRYYQYKTLKDCEMRYPESGDCEIGLLNYLFNGNLDMEKLCIDNPNCIFKQLALKTQEFEQLQEKYEALKLENQEGYEIVAELKQECEELKEKYEEVKEDRYNLNMEMYTLYRYRKALEEIEIIAKDGLNPICYKSNCSRCQ